ncbi:SAP30-binding protein-like [Stylophora pistillata]|uniref:SAP30-binding protein n=1 Tax=Stylophora pistillata TaxID=50429 RepID=A0A2B4SI31_STYPI|nr:SAP30-binding protein-like [Stylophora pistillata]PFX30314.1 SAP30-binding protein [Stylophora pistillata]
MDNQIIGSLNSLADYGLGESDIEDSDEDVEPKHKPIVVVRPSVAQVKKKTSARLVSYDDEFEEEKGEEPKDEEIDKDPGTVEEIVSDENVISKDVTDEDSSQEKNPAQDALMAISDSSEKVQSEEKGDQKVEDLVTETSNSIPEIKMPQLPPEPTGRCSNSLQEKVQTLLEKTHQENLDLNTNIQNRKKYRNPSIYKKLLQYLNIDETGSNYPKSLFDPTCWPEESYYENLSKAQKEAYERKEKEKAKQARTQVEFVSGTKKAGTGTEEPKKRKSKWDQTAVPATSVKTATPPAKVGVQGPVVSSSIDINAAKKPKVS